MNGKTIAQCDHCKGNCKDELMLKCSNMWVSITKAVPVGHTYIGNVFLPTGLETNARVRISCSVMTSSVPSISLR